MITDSRAPLRGRNLRHWPSRIHGYGASGSFETTR